MIDLDEMERLAKLATPGEWHSRMVFGQLNIQDNKYMLRDEDVAFIKSANPAAIVELVRRIRELEFDLMELQNMDIEELRAICDLTVRLTEIRWRGCNHLCVENFAPELFAKLINEFMQTKGKVEINGP